MCHWDSSHLQSSPPGVETGWAVCVGRGGGRVCRHRAPRGPVTPNSQTAKRLASSGLAWQPRLSDGRWRFPVALTLVFQLRLLVSVGKSMLFPPAPCHPPSSFNHRPGGEAGRAGAQGSRGLPHKHPVFPAANLAGYGAAPAGGALSPSWRGSQPPTGVPGDCPTGLCCSCHHPTPIVTFPPPKNSRKTVLCEETPLGVQEVWI